MPIFHDDTLFTLVQLDDISDWASLQHLCDDHLLKRDLDALRDALQHTCKAVIVEQEYVCKDYKDTYANYYAKKFATYPSRCHRLLFFRDRIAEARWWDVPSYAKSFIGYSVIRPTRITSIGRTILNPDYCKGVPKGYICRHTYKCNLMGTKLEVSGFPLISQDTDVTICAHAACWMCFRYFTERYNCYREIYPYQITQLTWDLSDGRLLPSRGLFIQQIVEMFSRFGFYPQIYFREDYDTPTAKRFDRLLYYYIESGLPALVGLPGHAVVAIGHTSDFNQAPITTLPTFSSDYMSGLIINDDNMMPYQSMGLSAGMKISDHQSTYVMSDIDTFVVPLPEKVYLTAQDIERLTLGTLMSKGWGLRHSKELNLNNMVLRLYCTTSRAYKQFRREFQPPNNLAVDLVQLSMPHFIWVSELSRKDKFPDGEVLGEIIWDATASQEDYYSWIMIHYPEIVFVNDRSSHNAGIDGTHLVDTASYPMYRHNLHQLP